MHVLQYKKKSKDHHAGAVITALVGDGNELLVDALGDSNQH
jgi:hypothetical protein